MSFSNLVLLQSKPAGQDGELVAAKMRNDDNNQCIPVPVMVEESYVQNDWEWIKHDAHT